MMVAPQGGRDLGRAPRAEGARRRHPPDPRDAAPVGRRHHRPHQGELPIAHRVPGRVEDRLAHDPRPDGRRGAARHRRHAVLRPRRARCSACTARYVDEDEIQRVVDFLKTQGKPVYDLDILKPREEEGEDGDGGDGGRAVRRRLYDQAVDIVARRAQVVDLVRPAPAAHRLQPRRAHGRAMERDGVVGPADGAKPREVLAPAGEYLAAGA